ncbi:hypothetical protein LguiA_035364 [Lonicera macranthoides]
MGAIIAPLVLGIIVIGNSAVLLGLWPAHFFWTYLCVAKTKRLGWVLKILLLVLLPVPLVLWPVIVIVGSMFGGIGYGFFAPLIATFEAVGENATHKFYHCFALNGYFLKVEQVSSIASVHNHDSYVFTDGCRSTIEGSCTVVRDFTDFCFHSYFSYMDELGEEVREDERPMDIKLLKLPSCLLVTLVAVPLDVLLITVVALWKSPYMLFRGWRRLLEDLIGREGPFLETVCVPFAGLAILLWPLAVIGAVLGAVLSSFFLGLYSGVIVHQEESLVMGFAYIVAVVSLFDEYTNDLLYLREGSCFPRPRYRRNVKPPDSLERRSSIDNEGTDPKKEREGSQNSKLASQRSRTLKWAIQQYTPVQVWDWLFKSCEVNGRILLRDGLIDVKDIEECIVKGKCNKLGIKLPAWSIMQCLLASAKSNSAGLVISDEVELTSTNWPKDKVFEWFVGPLIVMKEQIKGLQLDENKEIYLRKLVMLSKNAKPEWDDSGFLSGDNLRKAQLQGIIRRLQGIVGSLSRIPTFRRRFKNLVKILYLEAIETGLLGNQGGGSLNPKHGGKRFIHRGDKKQMIEAGEPSGQDVHDNSNIV